MMHGRDFTKYPLTVYIKFSFHSIIEKCINAETRYVLLKKQSIFRLEIDGSNNSKPGQTMLSKFQQYKILEEELFKTKINEEIESQKKAAAKQQKILVFLNSNLGIFILSSVFISLFSWGYNTYKYNIEEKRAATKNFERLKIEIVNRFSYIGKIGTKYPGEERVAIRTAIFGLNGGVYNSASAQPVYSPVFMEFKERSLLSLLIEVRQTKKINETSVLDSSIYFVDNVPEYFWKSIPYENKDTNYWYLPEYANTAFLKNYDHFLTPLRKVLK